MMRMNWARICQGALVAGFMAVPALAQDQSAEMADPEAVLENPGAEDAAKPAKSGPRVEEIIVTAERRAEALEDVPVSIIAFPKEQLDYRGIDELKDFAANIPNVSAAPLTGSAASVRLFIRGLGQLDTSPTQDPSVALYVDGVYVGSGFGTGFELVDLERVEILRGPQGTLYGRNATGGAVNMITAQPELGAWDFKQSFTVGNFGAFKSRSTINMPLGEDAGAKLSFLRSRRDGTVENTGLGVDFGLEDRIGARGDVSWEPNPDLTIDLAVDYSSIKDSSPYEQGRSGPASAGSYEAGLFDPVALNIGPVSLPLVQAQGNYTFADPIRQQRNDEGTAVREYLAGDVTVIGASITVSWDLGSQTSLKSISGYRKVDRRSFGEFAPYSEGQASLSLPGAAGDLLRSLGLTIPLSFVVGPGPIAQQTEILELEQFSQEIQILGETELWNGTLSYVAGGYFYRDDIFSDATNNVTLEGPRRLDLTNAENTALAAFTQATFTPDIWDGRLHLTVGARVSWDKRYADRINENSFAFAAEEGWTAGNCTTLLLILQFINTSTPCIPTGSVATAYYDETFSNFNPSGTVEFDLTDDANLYAKVVTGYKTGGTSTRSANPKNFSEGFEEEEMLSYELGLKGRFLDQRLQLNAALFQMDIDGYQASIQTGPTPGDRDFVGIDGTLVRGFELDVVFALTEWLFFRGAYGYLDSELGQDSVTILNDQGAYKTYALTERLAFAPDHSFSLTLDGFVPLAEGFDLAFYVGYNYRSEAEGSVNLDEGGQLHGYGLVDISISLVSTRIWGGDDPQLKASLFVKNLFDKDYEVTSYASFAFAGIDEIGIYGEPRTFGLTLAYDF